MSSCQKKSVQNSTASDCKEQKSSFQQTHSSEKEGHSWNQFNHLWVTDQAYVQAVQRKTNFEFSFLVNKLEYDWQQQQPTRTTGCIYV